MALAVLLILAVLATQVGHKCSEQTNVAMDDRMQQRKEYLNREMTQLLQEIEESSGAQEDTLLSVLYLMLIWTMLGALLCCQAWGIVCAFPGCYEEEDDDEQEEGNDEQEEGNDEQEEGNDKQKEGNLNNVRYLVESTPLLVRQGLPPDTCKVLRELVEDLLSVCRMICKTTFMLQMHVAVGEDGIRDAWSVHENTILYRLLVFLQPPRGYSFSLEEDTTGQLSAVIFRAHVVTECMCQREQLMLGDTCFLHGADNELPRDQSSDLLHRLCTDTYLDMEKVICWAQLLVRSAWLCMPQAQQCQLTLRPSSRNCTFQLTGTSTSKMTIMTELTFAVKPGSPGIYLSSA
ncbi:PREDICTED: inositol 1,4,5-trisphosphate receptor-interacting protein-like 1 [Apaloderma vittatum]|uniref:inositol 1,4,5-trisphosphate receptor-interacting protein-like 1 n=1 Tax=Apaloderma vittatum TaxID=57397 RepID=UPI0005214D33|nr:PREDICTED: inositol 1,4,5-trisphosphate receptor-interacting protein-like 1 [Apaloderma vittatum]